MIKKSIILFVLFYLASAHSQQTIDKLNSNQLKLPKETISKALSIDANGQVKSSTTSSDELGYLSGVTSAVQDQINDKANDADAVHLTGDESISGIKTLTGKLVTSSTTNASIPCPVMTQTQRDAIATPVTGDCVFNSDTSLSNIYDGAIWKAMGGSGGGISLWLTATGYAIDDVVIESNNIYICLTAHTSGTFATDLASLYWLRVSTDVTGATGLLPLATGGTNKSITASDGSIVYSDADSLELLAPGTSGQILQTNGAAAPTFVNKSISGKAQNTTAVTLEELQVPNNLLTATDANKYLNETGNTNILSNPSFEHSTFSTSWTNSAGTFTQETSVLISGKASAKLVLAAQTMALTQSSTLYAAQFADGVQGLAMVRIKSDIALSVCSIQAGTVSTTNCVTTATDSKWGLYKIPFVMGATSQGISIASSGSVSGTVYIDEAFVGAASLIQDAPIIGPWTSFTPTGAFTTNTTYTGKYRQVGQNLEIQYKMAFSGAPNFVNSTLLLPTGFTIDTNALNDATTNNYGIGRGSLWDNSGGNIAYPLFGRYLDTTSIQIWSGTTSAANLSNSGTLTSTGPITIAVSDTVEFTVSVPVNELRGSTSTYTSQCGANCVDTFSAAVSGGGTVFSQTSDFISGTCSITAAPNKINCTFKSGLFTIEPSCVAQNNGASTSSDIIATTTTTSGFSVNYVSSIVRGFSVICQKQGADFVATRTIQGSFKEVMVATGVTKPKTCYYAFGGAGSLSAPTECTSGTCVEYYDSCGTGAAPSWSTTAFYSSVPWYSAGTFAADSPVICTCQGFDATANIIRRCSIYQNGDSLKAESDGSLDIRLRGDDGATTQSTIFAMLKCEGSAP
jgi:hypothetical protein